MATAVMVRDGRQLNASVERRTTAFNGYLMLLVLVAALALTLWGLADAAGGDSGFGVALLIVGGLVSLFVLSGFYLLQPNQAAATLLFGDYVGTDRVAGLRWNWPWLIQKKVSTRVNNVTSERLKVNDLRGNPVEIASNIVWRVTDTAQALFDVDDYQKFLFVQIESALRHIAAKYPYDDIEHQEVTLRSHAEIVSEELKAELQDRVAVAGITVDECRLTHLAYAQEIAQAMLRRQQAEAVIAARAKLVLGAVTMVETALQMLSEKDVVHLDDERRAAMVSNLMVVLCSERDTQPVVNAGSLYQ